MAFLYGRAGRLIAKNAAFRPGQIRDSGVSCAETNGAPPCQGGAAALEAVTADTHFPYVGAGTTPVVRRDQSTLGIFAIETI